MADTTERARILIDLESQQAESALRKLQTELKQLKKDYKAATTPDEKSKLKESIEKTEADVISLKNTLKNKINVVIDGELAGKSLRDLEAAAKTLRRELKNTNPDTPEFQRGAQALQTIEGKMKSLNQTLKGTGGMWSRISDEMKAFGVGVAAFLGFNAIASQITNVINRNAKLSDSLADIRKTTGLTTTEVRKLNDSLLKIDTRTSSDQLREMAVVAGQLGIAQDKLAKAEMFKRSGDVDAYNAQMALAREELNAFVGAIDVANVALGDEFSGGAAEITDVLGKLRNVFSDVKSEKVDQDLLHIGNALNELGAAGAATAPVVADFANRIGGVGIPLGLTSSQVLGLSATLQELNVNTERGGTAVTRILQKMVTNTGEFASVAGMDVKEFTKLVNTDLFGAFSKVVEGVSSGGASATAFGKILNDLGVDGAGASEVISKLSTNSQLLTEKVDLAGKSLQNSNGVIEENNIKQATLGAQLDKLRNRFVNFATSPGITDFLSKQVERVNDFITWLTKLPKFISDNRVAFIALTGAVLLYNAAVIKATVSSWAETTAELAKNAVKGVGARLTALQTAATSAYSLVTGVLTGKITAATAAQRIQSAVMKAAPWMWVVTAVIAVVEAIDLYRKNTAEAIKLERDKKALTEQLVRTQNELTKTTEGFNAEIQKFNQLSPQEQQTLQTRITLKLKDAQASLQQMKAEQERITQESTSVGTWQAIWNSLKNGPNGAAIAMANFNDAIENGKEAGAEYDDKIKALEDSIGGMSDALNKVNTIQSAYSDAMKINAVTTDQYNEKLRLLRMALDNTAVGTDQYKKIALEIAAVQTELAKKSALGGVDTTEAIENLKRLQEQLLEIEKTLNAAGNGEYQNEIDAVADKYNKLRELASGNKAELTRIAALEKQELQQLEEKWNEKITELRDAQSDKNLSAAELEIVTIQDKYQKLIDEFQGYTDKIAEIEAIRDAEIAAKKQEQADKALADSQALQDQLFDLTLTDHERQMNAEADKWEKLILQAEASNAALLANNQAAAFDIEKLIRMKNAAILNLEKTSAASSAEIDERKRALKKQIYGDIFSIIQSGMAFVAGEQSEFEEFQKALGLAEIAVNTGLAIASLTRNAEANPANIPTGGLAGIAQFTAGLARIFANIAQAKQILSGADIPKYEQGGKLPGTDTVLSGPSHKGGGLKIVDTQSNKVVAEAEGGEPLISKKSYANNREIIDMVMAADGRSIREQLQNVVQFENGGLLPPDVTPAISTKTLIPATPPAIDYTRVIENVRNEQNLRVVSDPRIDTLVDQIANLTQALNTITSDSSKAQLMDAIAKLNATLENPKPVKNYVLFQDFEDAQSDMNKVRAGSSLERKY